MGKGGKKPKRGFLGEVITTAKKPKKRFSVSLKLPKPKKEGKAGVGFLGEPIPKAKPKKHKAKKEPKKYVPEADFLSMPVSKPKQGKKKSRFSFGLGGRKARPKKASKPKDVGFLGEVIEKAKPKKEAEKAKSKPVVDDFLAVPVVRTKSKKGKPFSLGLKMPNLRPPKRRMVDIDALPKEHKEHFHNLFKKSEKKKMEPIKFKELKKEEKVILSAAEIKRFNLSTIGMKIEKQKTGVEGLDKLFTQGIPKGASVLVEGGPGSGKTIFCLQVAHNICKRGGKALYMSFEEPEVRLLSHMKEFGWTPEKYIRNNQLLIKRYSAIDISRSVEALLSAAKKELLIEVRPVFFPKGFDPDIVLVDSLTSVASAFSGESSRFRVYMEQLFKYLEAENITSFLIRETPNPSHIGKSMSKREEAVSFLSDGIIAIYNVIMPTGERTGGIEVLKMRGEKFKKKIVQMEVTNKGIVVYPNDRIGTRNIIT